MKPQLPTTILTKMTKKKKINDIAFMWHQKINLKINFKK